MQKICAIIFIAFAAMTLVFCSTKKNAETGQHLSSHADASKAMEEYHELMAQSFHPFMDSGNLLPAKAHADDLAAAASRWADLGSADQPDTALVSKLRKLKTNSRAFADLVKNGDDNAIGKSLENLHHEFHAIMELWSNEPKEHSSE